MMFKRGEFRPFRPTTTVHLGSVSRDLVKDSVFEFDGTVVRFAEGDEVTCPQVAAGLKKGWAVPADDVTTQYIPKTSGIKIHTNPDDPNSMIEMQRVDTVEDETVVKSLPQVEDSDGRVVKTIQSRTNDFVSVGKGPKKSVNLAAVSQQSIEALVDVPLTRDMSIDNPPQVRVASEGVSRAGDTLESIMPDAAVAAAPSPSPAKADAGAIQEVLSSWDMARHWKHRVEEAVEFYSSDQRMLDAIYGMESPGVVRQIKAKLGQ